MGVFCSARKGRAWGGGGGARAGGKERSVLIDFLCVEYSWQMFRISQTSLMTVPSASPVEGSRRSGSIRMQNTLKNASIVVGWRGVEDGCEFVGYIRGKTISTPPALH